MTQPTSVSLQTHAPALPPPLDPHREMRIRTRWEFWRPQCILRIGQTLGYSDAHTLARLQSLHYSRIRVCYDRCIPLNTIRRYNLDSPLIYQEEFLHGLIVAIERRASRMHRVRGQGRASHILREQRRQQREQQPHPQQAHPQPPQPPPHQSQPLQLEPGKEPQNVASIT